MLLNYWFKAWFWPFLPYVKTAYLGSKQQLSGRGWCKYWPWASRGAELRPTPWPDAHRTMVATALTHQWNTGNRGRRPGMSFSLHSSSWVLEPGYGRDIQVSPPPPPPHMMDVDTFLNRPITFIIWGQSSQYIFITVLLKMCAMLLKTLSMNSPFRKKKLKMMQTGFFFAFRQRWYDWSKSRVDGKCHPTVNWQQLFCFIILNIHCKVECVLMWTTEL